MSRAPKRQLARRQRRQKKIRYLRRRLEETTNPQVRNKLIAKLRRVSPRAPIPGQ
jgi:hypothetical protein